ncbi:beta-ketoacyl synthase chain length factor [Arcobacteraceae bacterium]|nr:beta-ketoacyl synthase chain length factor [Arcobacteraceae bacterium]
MKQTKKINLQILDACVVLDKTEIVDLNTKKLVPKMVTRRRLTRASKIAIYLASKVNYSNERILFGSSFGELLATDTILNSIADNEPISPTHFQNSVYNTAISYLSILSGNEKEIMTISSGDNTSKNILKSAAVKALDGDELLLMGIETLNIPNINDVNDCIEYLECGVALRVKFTEETANLKVDSKKIIKIPNSLVELYNVAINTRTEQNNIIEVEL